MPPFFLIFRDILLLRRGPQDLPHSTQLLTTIAAACVVVQTVAATILVDQPATTLLVSALFSVLLTLIALNVMLGLRRLRNRFVQAAIALLGCNLVFTLIGIPVATFLPTKPTAADQMPAISLLFAPLLLAFVIWQIAVNAHVLRHSLDLPLWGGVAMVLLWVIIAAVLAGIAGSPAML